MNKIPTNLEEAITALDAMLKDYEREMILSDQGAQLHHNLGQYLRNTWQLWQEGTPLNAWFKENGIHHADDMTAVLFRATRRRLLKYPYNIKTDAEHYKLYWDVMKDIEKNGRLNIQYTVETNEYGERVVRVVAAK